MAKTAFVFPGQGSQYCGMGKDIYEETKALYQSANAKLGFDISDIIFNQPEKLNLTMYTQPAIVLTSYALYSLFTKQKELAPDYLAGHSVGEYTALAVAGSISMEEAVLLTYHRGRLMQEACANGSMAAVLGVNKDVAEEVVATVDGVGIANYNSPEQTVISGYTESVEEASHQLKAAGAKVIRLPVSVPAHSPLLNNKADEFSSYLNQADFKDAEIPVIANTTAQPVRHKAQIVQELKKQFYSPVLWQQSIEWMVRHEVETFYEIGPKKVLTGLIRRISSRASLINIDSLGAFQKQKENL